MKKHNIYVGNGGTFFEIAHTQGKTEQFFNYCREIGFNLIEISNGSISLSSQTKSEAIRLACTMGFMVISEVGKKEPLEDDKLTVEERIAEAQSDLQAGASQVIIEAREGGKSLGIYDDKGGVKEDMAQTLVKEIGIENIMFEAPEKSQQEMLTADAVLVCLGCQSPFLLEPLGVSVPVYPVKGYSVTIPTDGYDGAPTVCLTDEGHKLAIHAWATACGWQAPPS